MKSYGGLVLRQLRSQKVTTVLILIAIILSAVMTTAVGQSLGTLSAMRQQQAIAIGGDCHITFVQMNEEQAAALRSDSRLEYAGRSVSLGTVQLNDSLRLGLNEYMDGSLAVQPALSRVKEGRLPQSPMEIALPEDALQYLGFGGGIGDTICLSGSKALRHNVNRDLVDFDYTEDFTLCGILESNYLGYTSGVVQGVVGAGTARQLLPQSFIYYNVAVRVADGRHFQDTVNDLVVDLKIHELDTLYNTVYLDAAGIKYDAEAADVDVSDEGFGIMTLAGVMVAVLILLAAGLVIFNILKIVVSRRMKQYGVLRALGAERRQLYLLVLAEVFVLCAVGIPVGLLLGALAAESLVTVVTGLFSPQVFMVQDTAALRSLIAENSSLGGWLLAASALITLAFALAAAVPAARRAAAVSPVAVISGQQEKIIRRRRKPRRIRSFAAYYARLNLGRNRGKTIITVVSLALGVAVFIALQSCVGLLNAAGQVEEDRFGDYSITNTTIGFSESVLQEMAADEDVAAVAAMQFFCYDHNADGALPGITVDLPLQSWEAFQVVGLNDVYMQRLLGERLSEADMQALEEGRGCVVRNPVPMDFGEKEIPTTNVKQGSVITVNGRPLLVLLVLDGYDMYFSVGTAGFTNGVQVAVSSGIYRQLTGSGEYAELIPALQPEVDRAAFDKKLDSLCRSVPGTAYISYEETDKQLAESFQQTNMLAWGLILFVGLIGVLNIINTVYTNIHTRVGEIGIQRAIGMDVRGLYRTFLWEGLYYGVYAAVAGSVLGLVCVALIECAVGGSPATVSLPWAAMAMAAAVVIGVCLIATFLPLRQVARLDVAAAIGSGE